MDTKSIRSSAGNSGFLGVRSDDRSSIRPFIANVSSDGHCTYLGRFATAEARAGADDDDDVNVQVFGLNLLTRKLHLRRRSKRGPGCWEIRCGNIILDRSSRFRSSRRDRVRSRFRNCF